MSGTKLNKYIIYRGAGQRAIKQSNHIPIDIFNSLDWSKVSEPLVNAWAAKQQDLAIFE
jgi:hypothetical protein